ncbi:MAG: hypothetical protein WCO66_02280 [Candidatus Absconditabacteria bacterium]
MAINTTDQNNKLLQTNEQLRTRNNLSNIINQDVFGVLTTERRIVIDNNSLIQLGNLNTNINYPAQVATLTTQIAAIDIQIGSAVPPYTGLNSLLDYQRTRNPSAEAIASGVPVGQIPAMTNSISNDIQRRISDLTNQINALVAQRTPLETQRTEYNTIITTYGPILTLRNTELTNLIAAANNFNSTNQIPNSAVVNYRGNCDFGGGVNTTNLETAFRGVGALPIAYALCDNTSGTVLAGDPARGYQVTTATGQIVTLRGITIAGTPVTILTGTTITVDPVEGLTFPLNLEIGVRGRITENTINLDSYKTVRLTINAPQLTLAQRQVTYDTLNTGTTINTRINIEHTNNNRTREDDVLREMLSAGGKQPEVDVLRKDEAQAREFIKRIRAIPGLIPVVSIAQAINPAGFRAAMTDPTRNVPVQHLVNEAAFADYLTNNLDANIQEYLSRNIRTTLDNVANRNTILREFLDFQTELKNNKVDSPVDQDALGDIAGVEMDSKRWLPLLGRKDKNYMKFFSGASIDMGSQTVNLNKEVKYGLNLKVSGKNEITASIKIGDKKEIIKKGGDPMKLIKDILNEKSIPEGKTRLHIAYNVIAGMIQIAKNEDISLSYRDAAGHNQVIKLDGKNIILEDQDDLTNHATGRRITTTLFDYSLFESTNSFEDPNRSGRHVLAPDNRTLRIGLERLTKHFNVAMNQVNANYDCATERKLGGLLRSNTSSDFPSSAWTSPIKKLLNCKTTTNFDFATSVSHNGKSVQIERKGNIFFLTIDGVELKGKDLGKLLKKRKGGIRLFDGVERAICGEIYKNMVEKLRTNTKIARSSFGVMDPKTGRMYIVDEDGQLGYLRAEEAAVEEDNLKKNLGVNTAANVAIAGGLGAAGIATGGAAALAAGLSWGAVGTAANWGSMTAPGIAIFKDIRRIAGKGYGTLDHTPAARTICDEAETREIYKDPYLMGKLMKVMNLRLGQI